MFKINRRNFLRVSGASLCTPTLALSNVNQDNTTEIEKEIQKVSIILLMYYTKISLSLLR